MTARPTGRRTESLFDNRYRYDYIFPRGRSGETLRAYDILDNDRPVVIKRPAPQDAPPMRAGQEVSIRNERHALERLSGHPVLTELRGSGTFRVGGHTHEYIVMDLAEGEIVEDMVFALAQHNRFLPDLEALVIVDNLLDLLAHAHDKQVIYNDVDAKHLFWDRDTYRLKVIDWGNAVFTDEPGAPPTISRATDIYQCGELLYFIFTGGSRLATEAEDNDSFFVNFGPNAERIPPRLQTAITRAVHPDPKRRFGSIPELRSALADVRAPLEKSRDEIVSRIRKRVRPTASQEELEELLDALDAARESDPGYPETARLAAEIESLLRQIAVQADLDAIRIYLESANWTRALSLLHDLLPQADETNAPVIQFLIASAALLEDLHVSPPPAGFLNALDALFAGDAPAAGHMLLTAGEARTAARRAQWLVAEQLAAHLPQVVLLRPHLVRLRFDLQDVADTSAVHRVLDEVDAELARPPVQGLTGLKVIYQQVLAQFDPLEEAVGALADRQAQEDWLASVIRARRAAHDVITMLDEVGNCMFEDPARAGSLLHRAAMIDPTSPHFEALHDYFDEVHQAVVALGQFKPRADGSNLATWFADVHDFLQPYLDDLSDPQLHAAANAIQRAGQGWSMAISYLALGRRQPGINILRDTAETIRPFNENTAAWLNTLANRLPNAGFVERHSPNERLADHLIDGWKAWDRGDAIAAAQHGRDARSYATTDGERLAADRLRRLAELLDNWLSHKGPHNAEMTDRAQSEALSILLSEEEDERRTFAEQMPNTTLYLRAMSRGLVAYMHQSSSAGWRALYLHYVLRGVLSILDEELDDAEFWRECAAKTFDDAPTHRAFQVLDRALTGRRLVDKAQRALNAVVSPADLEGARAALNAPLAAELLTGSEQSVQMTIEAVRSWSDGNFHGARGALDAALDHIQTAIQVGGLEVEPYVNWLTRLRDTVASLQQSRIAIEQGALSANPEPDSDIAGAHQRIVDETLAALGPDHAHQVRQWNDMYNSVLETYTTQRLTRREKLAAFSRHFSSLFITKHPAYPLFRHWEEIIEQLPPDVAEDDMFEVEAPAIAHEGDSLAYLEGDREPERAAETRAASGRDLPWNRIIAVAIVLLIAVIAVAIWRTSGSDDTPARTGDSGESSGPAIRPAATSTPERTATESAAALAPAATQAPTPVPPTPTATEAALTATPTGEPTEDLPPSPTPTLFVTSTLIPSDTPPPEPVEAAAPISNVLAVLDTLPEEARDWPAGAFVPGDGDAWRMVTEGSPNAALRISLPPSAISQLFQPGAASTISRADVVLELVDYDPAALQNGDVTFGLGAENTSGQSAIAEVQFVEENYVRLGLNQSGQFRLRTESPQPAPRLTLSVRRVDANTLGFFVDGKRLGDSVLVFPQGAPITLILTASGQGVVVGVSDFEIEFNPRGELP